MQKFHNFHNAEKSSEKSSEKSVKKQHWCIWAQISFPCN